MSQNLTIIARIQAKKENTELVKKEVLKLIEPTRKEEGCIQYELYQDNETPDVFIFSEIWENKELWQSHIENIPLQNFIKLTDGLLADLTVNQMTKIS